METIANLITEHSELTRKLAAFSFSQAIQLTASMSLCPELLVNTARIELLQHLVAVSCKGNRIPTASDLTEWAEKGLENSPLVLFEDPEEDVFVDYICSAFGGFRVFPGIFSDAAFWGAKLLEFVTEKRDFPPFQDAIPYVAALLKISDTIAKRLGLARYSQGGGNPGSKIIVPETNRLQANIQAVSFSPNELASLEIDKEILREFVLTPQHISDLPEAKLWNSPLERHPIIEIGDSVVVAVPSSLIRAIVRYLLERISLGMGGWGDTFFQVEMASNFVNRIRNRLNIEPLSFEKPPSPQNLPPMFPHFGYFDFGKPVIMLSQCTDLTQSASDFNGDGKFTEDEEAALDTFLRACASEFEKVPGFSSGLILVSLSCIGRSYSFGVKRIPNWHIHVASLPDWMILTADHECTAMRLWKLSEHEAALRDRQTKSLNLSGLLNLYGYWEENGFRLVPRTTDPRSLGLLYINSDFATSLRVRTKLRRDAHCVRAHDAKTWVTIVRRSTDSLFAHDESMEMYFAQNDADQGRLLGCIPEGERLWWVTGPERQPKPEISRLIFQLWDCVASWIVRVSRIGWAHLKVNSIEIQLHLPDVEKWERSENQNNAVDFEELSTSIDLDHALVRLKIPQGFLRIFSTPKNVGEQRIITALIRSIGKLAKTELTDEQCSQYTADVIGSEDARFFHVVAVSSVEQILGGLDRTKPAIVQEEDFAVANLGLADLVGRPSIGNEIQGLQECRKFLEDAVSKVWQRIEMTLKDFDRNTIVQRCFHELNEIARDEGHWDMTTRSALALRDNQKSVYDVLFRQRSDRASATVCNRLIIETAQYASANQDGKTFSAADHSSVLANMVLLLLLSNHRDAISYGFIEPKLTIAANGELDVDERFYADTMFRYFSEMGREVSDRAAADYETYFPDARSTPDDNSADIDAFIEEFDKVFTPEYGFSIHLLFKARNEFRSMALTTKMQGGPMDEELMFRFLSHCGFTQAEAEAFLECFTLPIRSAWDKELPARCHQDDVYPWRHRRQLSLLAKPFVQECLSPRRWLVSIPVFERHVSYWLDSLEQARFTKQIFKSSEMQRYVEKVIDRRGHEFSEQVEILFSNSGYLSKREIAMTHLGAPKHSGLGDVDVLAWHNLKSRVYVVECKRLLVANSVGEVVQRLRDFRGSREERDSLGRHLRRIDWLQANLNAISQFTGVPLSNIEVFPLLVTSEIVPMQFYEDMNFPTSQVMTYKELVKMLK